MSTAKVVVVLILVTALLAGAGLYADITQVAGAVADFYWPVVAAGLLLAFGNYVVRFFKWNYFLKAVGKPVEARTSALAFFSGLSMSVTPGKVGELLKSYLLKQTSGVPASASAPVVVAERLTDLLSLLVLAAFGVVSSGYGLDVVIAACVLCGAVIVLALWRRAGAWVLNLFARIPRLKNTTESFAQLQESMFKLVGPRSLLIGTALSIVAWFAECFAFYLILAAAGIDLSLGNALFVYCLGTIAGAVTMLPGGLVATEASMVVMLVELFRAATKPAAVTSVFVVRLCTLWFAVLVGIIAMAILRRRFGPAQRTVN